MLTRDKCRICGEPIFYLDTEQSDCTRVWWHDRVMTDFNHKALPRRKIKIPQKTQPDPEMVKLLSVLSQ